MWVLGLKFLLLVAYLGPGLMRAQNRLLVLDFALQLAFIALYLLCVAGLVTSALARQLWARILLATLFTAASLFQLGYEGVAHQPINYGLAIDLFYGVHQLGPALEMYGDRILFAGAVSLCLFWAIALPPRPYFLLRTSRAFALPLFVSLLLGVIVWQRGGYGTEGLPAAYPPLVYAGLMATDELTRGTGTRPGLIGAPVRPRLAQDIILIVDESVSGNYLDLTNADGVRSGLMTPRPGIRVTNFGYAAAIHMCSTGTNRVLRYGGSQQTFAQAVVNWPSIWRYAHRAGMRTIYIDAQLTGGARHNRMSAREAADIDIFHQFDGVPIAWRDHRAADLIAWYSRNGRPDFIYVNKAGAHFPVTNKYPTSQTLYRPVPPPQGFADRAFADVAQSDLQPEEWRLYRNAYRNALHWSVGRFFDRLLGKIDARQAVVIYTSDHGQDLHERGNPGANTHCGLGSSAQEQGVVPLAIIEAAGAKRLNWQAALAANRHRATGFRIFPTLRVLMGFDRAAIRRDHGRPLDEPPADAFAFVEDFQALGGATSRFRQIDRAKIVRPPRSDFISGPIER